MATLKEWLDELEFDYDSGEFILWDNKGEVYSWEEDAPKKSILVAKGREDILLLGILTREFDDGYGSPEAPHFIAYDKDFIYLPASYDGSTWAYKVARNSEYYHTHLPPYEGG